MMEVGLLFLLALAVNPWATLAVICDPSMCGEGSVCDVGCTDDPAVSVLDSRGCDQTTLCRQCIGENSSSSSPSSSKSRKKPRKKSRKKSSKKSSKTSSDSSDDDDDQQQPSRHRAYPFFSSRPISRWNPISALKTQDITRQLVEQIYLPDTPYDIPGVGNFIGYDSQSEYTMAAFSSGNFQQHYFSKFTVESITETSEGVYVVENLIEATYYTYEENSFPPALTGIGGPPIPGVQLLTFHFPPGEIRTNKTMLEVDLNFIAELSENLLQSDLTQLCLGIFFFCDQRGFSTGYDDGGGDFVAACADNLSGLTDFGLDTDSVQCRQLYLILTQENPTKHCPYVAKDSTACGI